jgi:hypothetical protein
MERAREAARGIVMLDDALLAVKHRDGPEWREYESAAVINCASIARALLSLSPSGKEGRGYHHCVACDATYFGTVAEHDAKVHSTAGQAAQPQEDGRAEREAVIKTPKLGSACGRCGHVLGIDDGKCPLSAVLT